MATGAKSRKFKRKEAKPNDRIWPVEVRTACEVCLDHRMVATDYVRIRCCHGTGPTAVE